MVKRLVIVLIVVAVGAAAAYFAANRVGGDGEAGISDDTKKPVRKWTIEEFLAEVRNRTGSDEDAEITRDLYFWSKDHFDNVRFGLGVEATSFFPELRVVDKKDRERTKLRAVFAVGMDGNVYMRQETLEGRGAGDLLRKLCTDLGWTYDDNWKYFRDTFVGKPENLERFKEGVLQINALLKKV